MSDPPFDFNAYHCAWVANMDARPPMEKGSNAYMRELLGRGWTNPIPRIVCADGFSMSVQASASTYCDPRIDRAWPYQRVEIGFPSSAEPSIASWAEDSDELTSTVYAYVPVDLVESIVDKHGGCVSWPPSPYDSIPQ